MVAFFFTRAKSDFSQMRRGDPGLIKNAERFARIDLDRSRFEKERNQCPHSRRPENGRNDKSRISMMVMKFSFSSLSPLFNQM